MTLTMRRHIDAQEFSDDFTLPNTVCLLSSHGVLTQVIKNWQPLVSGPLLAMDKSPGPV